MRILKFGGSSVANPERIQNVANIIKSYHEKGENFAVVVSAMGGMTDLLIEMSKVAASGSTAYEKTLDFFSNKHREVVMTLARDYGRYQAVLDEIIEGQVELGNLLKGLYLTRDLTPRTMDYIQSFGERSSAFMLSEVLNYLSVPAIYVNARNLVITDDHFGSAKVYEGKTEANIKRFLAENPNTIPIITGFIASTEEGIATTLGRGGSDYTASIFAAATQASEIEIWTDVDGVLTADPRKVKQAFPVAEMTYEEAMEMSHFGAKVIYPPTIMPALQKNIPIRIKNSFNPDAAGTLISRNAKLDGHTVKGIASVSDVSLLSLDGSGIFSASVMAARLFGVLSRKEINPFLITQGSSQHSISLAMRPEEAKTAKVALEEEFELEMKAKLVKPVVLDEKLAIIAVVGDNMKSKPGISGRFFDSLGKNGINIVVTAQGSSERNISVVIRKEDEGKALNSVHDVFFLSDYYVLNLFIVGVGLIGSELLRQIKQQAEYLLDTQYVDFNIVALANSKKMLFRENGISLLNWAEELNKADESTDLRLFVDRMKALNMANSVFVDNTADDNIQMFYPEILNASISISTPNKVAVSSSYEEYLELKRLADLRNVKFFYETNVGAGLPVLTTLNDLINSGDRILRIEGVLSGSLSFIFNSFNGGKRFSEIVTEAQQRGYTEPDPRVDLSGKDVSRKLLILARESGLAMEAEEINIQNILPKPCVEAETVEQFMQALANSDDYFEELRAKAAANGKVLRFIATLEGENAFISLQEVDESNPFFNLSGSDNMIVFTSERYKERPLVIKGPGAGAEVTAAGVFAEILRIGYYLS
ncbi:MAG: bifunctional aspartate kinase/homoserine dehydrogenase I [Bacteroidota bacterium]